MYVELVQQWQQGGRIAAMHLQQLFGERAAQRRDIFVRGQRVRARLQQDFEPETESIGIELLVTTRTCRA